MNHTVWRKTRVSLAITIGIALVPLVYPQGATADTVTITLISGNGSVGSQDPGTRFSVDGGATYQDAWIISPVFNYDTITGTQWVSVDPSGYGPTYTTMLYQTTFVLPPGASGPSFTTQLFADDQASVYLNGTFLGQQSNIPTPGHPYPDFTFPTSVFSTSDPSLFLTGTNVIGIVNYNGNNPTGLDYDALVSYQLVPEPSTGILLALGVGALVTSRRLNRRSS